VAARHPKGPKLGPLIKGLDADSAARLRAALEEAGVIFTASGVKLRRRPQGGMVPERLNAEKVG
jgi:hypothetical protein